ncbi:MAG: hypothetical protein QXL51_00425 [Candidatus Aenigmatarchaeota archaeon]
MGNHQANIDDFIVLKNFEILKELKKISRIFLRKTEEFSEKQKVELKLLQLKVLKLNGNKKN